MAAIIPIGTVSGGGRGAITPPPRQVPPPRPTPIPPGFRPPPLPSFISGGPLTRQTPIGAPPPRFPETVAPPGFSVSEWAAVIQYSVNFAQWLANALSGRPKLLDTAEAIQRLAQSGLWQLQALAANLEIWLRNGVPLSTSDPRLQAQLRDWIHGALSSLGLTQAQILTVDTVLWQVLASETAVSARALDQLIAAFQAANRVSPPPSQPPPPPRQVPRPQVTPAPMGVPNPPMMFQPSQPPMPSPRPPGGQTSQPRGVPDIFNRARQLAERIPEGVGLGLELSRQIPFTPENIAQIGSQIGQEIGGLLTTQPQHPPFPDLIDITQDCPSCRTVAQQQRQLERSIRTEVGQAEQQRLEQIQGQIDRLEQLEKQPRETRDITEEIRQKQDLQRQLLTLQQQERQILRTEQPQPQLPPFPEVLPAPQPAIQPPPPPPPQPHHVQFCVGCASTEDAISFLNGEVSQCSVVPGSTREV